MNPTHYEVAMTAATEASLHDALIRSDKQEDVCFALWTPSSGASRQTALLGQIVPPGAGDRHVHGNASFERFYARRAAEIASADGCGLALLHSHPVAEGWQELSEADAQAERSLGNMAQALTGLPVVGLTLACGDKTWSARIWNRGHGHDTGSTDCEAVRVVGPIWRADYHPRLRPIPKPQPTQERTISAWGEHLQAQIARARVLVVGAGSVGTLVIEALARTGVEHIAVMDFDRVELVNLDRLHGATIADARSHLPKAELARRILRSSATAALPDNPIWQRSVCEDLGLAVALDYDLIFSCVDRPWPRHVLNTIAHTDLIPVIDGGLRLDPLPHGGLRNATWRSHIAMPGQRCMRCIGQFDPSEVQLERDGSLTNPTYIANLPPGRTEPANQNVAILSQAVSSALLGQFLSLVAGPAGIGYGGPLRHTLATHQLIHEDETECESYCAYQRATGVGDRRPQVSGLHAAADKARRATDTAAAVEAARPYMPIPGQRDRAVGRSARRMWRFLRR